MFFLLCERLTGSEVALVSFGMGVRCDRTDFAGELLMIALAGFPEDRGLLPCP